MYDYASRKMIANYHTHTHFCRHASGTVREYAEYAVSRGLDTLGFACHAPQPFPGDYYSGFRMKREEMDAYVDEILAVREEFAGRLRVLIGYEAEYYPSLFRSLLDMLNRRPCDYIIMGQHYVGNEYEDEEHQHVWDTDSIDFVRRYAAQVAEGMRLGVYTYVAHPDMLGYSGNTDEYLEAMSVICRTSLETDTPLELNLLGLADGRCYPNEAFFKTVGEYGCRVIVGCDAHSPERVADPDEYRRAMKLAERCSLNIIDRVTLRRPVLG